jgi:hypothetical protein
MIAAWLIRHQNQLAPGTNELLATKSPKRIAVPAAAPIAVHIGTRQSGELSGMNIANGNNNRSHTGNTRAATITISAHNAWAASPIGLSRKATEASARIPSVASNPKSKPPHADTKLSSALKSTELVKKAFKKSDYNSTALCLEKGNILKTLLFSSPQKCVGSRLSNFPRPNSPTNFPSRAATLPRTVTTWGRPSIAKPSNEL